MDVVLLLYLAQLVLGFMSVAMMCSSAKKNNETISTLVGVCCMMITSIPILGLLYAEKLFSGETRDVLDMVMHALGEKRDDHKLEKKKYRVMVVKYGYAEVEAEDESDALEQAKNMQDSSFDWSNPDDAQVVEEID